MKLTKKKDTRPVKCPHCEERLPRGEAIRHTNGRYFHENCYEEATQESRHYRELISYICEVFNLKRPSGQMLMQIRRYKEDPELQYTDKGMELTLRYFYGILDNNPRDGDGIGIIPWVYDEATEQYVRQLKIDESIEKHKNDKIEEIVVHIDTNKSRKIDKGLFDIESL